MDLPTLTAPGRTGATTQQRNTESTKSATRSSIPTGFPAWWNGYSRIGFERPAPALSLIPSAQNEWQNRSQMPTYPGGKGDMQRSVYISVLVVSSALVFSCAKKDTAASGSPMAAI